MSNISIADKTDTSKIIYKGNRNDKILYDFNFETKIYLILYKSVHSVWI